MYYVPGSDPTVRHIVFLGFCLSPIQEDEVVGRVNLFTPEILFFILGYRLPSARQPKEDLF